MDDRHYFEPSESPKYCRECDWQYAHEIHIKEETHEQVRITERARVLAAINQWKSEGRDEHDLWAMNNFLSGAGAFLNPPQP